MTFTETDMRAADLAKVWGASDNSRLTAKQQSFRLPTHVAAKINALCDVYPNRTKTEIVGDLLAAALDEAIRHLPSYPTDHAVDRTHDGTELYEACGPAVDFQRFANARFKELEKELGNDAATDLFTSTILAPQGDGA
jgi:hypothetical protein